MKILYVASNSLSSRIQFERFVAASRHLNITIRYAAFDVSCNQHPVDYTLDALDDFYGALNNKDGEKDIVNHYISEIQAYRPDLILNDFHFYTSYAATELSIPYWLVSGSLSYFAFEYAIQRQVKLSKFFKYFIRYRSFINHRFQIENAEKRLVYSCLGDLAATPQLHGGFEWTRPYYVAGKPSDEPAGFIAPLVETEKSFIKFISDLGDVYLYSDYEYESFPGIQHRNYLDPRYAETLSSAYLMFSRGETSFVADAFYNQKFSMIYPDYTNFDTIINASYMEHFGLAQKIYTKNDFDQLENLSNHPIKIQIKMNPESIPLHRHIEALCT